MMPFNVTDKLKELKQACKTYQDSSQWNKHNNPAQIVILVCDFLIETQGYDLEEKQRMYVVIKIGLILYLKDENSTQFLRKHLSVENVEQEIQLYLKSYSRYHLESYCQTIKETLSDSRNPLAVKNIVKIFLRISAKHQIVKLCSEDAADNPGLPLQSDTLFDIVTSDLIPNITSYLKPGDRGSGFRFFDQWNNLNPFEIAKLACGPDFNIILLASGICYFINDGMTFTLPALKDVIVTSTDQNEKGFLYHLHSQDLTPSFNN